MFFTEARIAGKLQHPNVVAIAGFGAVDGIHCLAMEYVFGASLAQVLRASARAKKPLTVGVLLRITATVCDALHYAHELKDEGNAPMGLVHRDVTPQNILIGFNGVPKLTDFGIAKATNRGWETQAGIVKGKFSYMSPEQALGKKVDRRSDIFGTGIVLWEALTGRDLFRGSTPMEVLTAIREQKIEPPSKVVPGLTPIVDPIVMKALQRSPRRRYSTALEMKNEIEDLIRRAGVEIDSQIISREFAAIYGDEIVERAFALRAAMAGKPDLPHLAKTLGGSVLNPKHLPIIPGGVTDPDPLGLFGDTTPASDEESELPIPARTDRSFSEAVPQQDDFEIIEGHEEEEPQFEVAFDEAPAVPEERLVSGWDDSTAMAVPDDELLSMLSEEDATIGYLPPEFAERFGQELQQALEEDESEFEDELTVGMPEGPALQRLRSLHADDDSMSGPWDDHSPGPRTRAPTKSLRPIPRAPSLDMRYNPDARTRPVPRAPSLDMEVDDEGRTPLPVVGTTYDPVAEPPLPSRAPLRAPPPPPPAPPKSRPPSLAIDDRPTMSSDTADAPTPLLPSGDFDEAPLDSLDSLDPLDALDDIGVVAPVASEPPDEPELAIKAAPTNGRASSDLLPPPAGAALSPDSLRALASDPSPSSPSSPSLSAMPRAESFPSELPPPVAPEKKGSGIQVSVGMLIFLVLSLLAVGLGIGLLVSNKM